MSPELERLRVHPYFDRAVHEVGEICPPQLIRTMDVEVIKELMVLAWLRGAAWNSHDTH